MVLLLGHRIKELVFGRLLRALPWSGRLSAQEPARRFMCTRLHHSLQHLLNGAGFFEGMTANSASDGSNFGCRALGAPPLGPGGAPYPLHLTPVSGNYEAFIPVSASIRLDLL
ncbi:hypothetical protein NDU88_005557 [Pleurodeles waltl]|uniref:Uncharacterized protein n=1 Tax=Pleurodeles waltl TaxID=8319 RepID=A0AAV7PH63_PLEWA|nr:hypothetical protein NDU88_005557 [Pleurodeles waltl]